MFAKGDIVQVVEGQQRGRAVLNKDFTVADVLQEGENVYLNIAEIPASKFFDRRFFLVKKADGKRIPVKKVKPQRAITALSWVTLKKGKAVHGVAEGVKYAVCALHDNGKHLKLHDADDDGLWQVQDNFELARNKAGALFPMLKALTKPKDGGHIGKAMKAAKGDSSDTCSWIWKRADGSVEKKFNQPCHAAMGYGDAKGVVEVYFGITHYVKKHGQDYKDFIEYVVYRSPYAKCFEVGKENIWDCNVKGNVNVTADELVSAAVALRQGSEYSSATLPLFKKFKELGVNENVAWFMSQFLSESRGKYHLRQASGHSAIDIGQGTEEQLAEVFVKGLTPRAGKKPYKDGDTGYAIFKTFGCPKVELYGDVKGNSLYTKLSKLGKGGGGFGDPVHIEEKDLLAWAAEFTKLINN